MPTTGDELVVPGTQVGSEVRSAGVSPLTKPEYWAR